MFVAVAVDDDDDDVFLDCRFFRWFWFSLCYFLLNIKSLFETQRRTRISGERKLHLNALFIALSCNIGVNLFGGWMSHVYV